MYQAAVFIHLASAIIWIGGALFLALVLIPVLRRYAPTPGQPPADPTLPPDMLGAIARRFRWISWVCIVLVVATGLYILPTRYGIGFAEFFSVGGHFVGTLQVKVALVAIVIWLSVIHDFIIGPFGQPSSSMRCEPAQTLRDISRHCGDAWCGSPASTCS